jgi:hypothetical protein
MGRPRAFRQPSQLTPARLPSVSTPSSLSPGPRRSECIRPGPAKRVPTPGRGEDARSPEPRSPRLPDPQHRTTVREISRSGAPDGLRTGLAEALVGPTTNRFRTVDLYAAPKACSPPGLADRRRGRPVGPGRATDADHRRASRPGAVVAGRREIHVRREPTSPELHIGMHEIVTN